VIEVKVPDIGDFTDVPIIEVLVAPGDTVAPEDPLITLESDKASMDVPSPGAGVVKELSVEVGDTVSMGTLILTLEEEAAEGDPADDGKAPSAEAPEPAEPDEPDDEPAPPEPMWMSPVRPEPASESSCRPRIDAHCQGCQPRWR